MLLVAAELMQRVAPTTIFLLLFLWVSGISYRAISTVTCTQQKATSEGVGSLGFWGKRDALCRGYCEIRRLPFLFTRAMFEIWSYSLLWQKCHFPIEGLVSKCNFNESIDYKWREKWVKCSRFCPCRESRFVVNMKQQKHLKTMN